MGDAREIMALAYEVFLVLQTKFSSERRESEAEFFKKALKYPLDLEDFSNLEEFLELFPKGSSERTRFLKQLYQYYTNSQQ